MKVVKMWIVIWTGGPSAGHAALGWCSSESHQGEPKAFFSVLWFLSEPPGGAQGLSSSSRLCD